jgi:hypothetical protein
VSGIPPKRPDFSLAEFRAFKFLAIILAVITAAIGFVSRSEVEQLLAIGLAATIMIVAPLAVLFFRRRKIGK